MDSLRKKEFRLDEMMPLIRERLAAGQPVRIGPMGTSMMPMLRQGRDHVVLHPVTGKLEKYDLPLYQRDNGQYVLHRIVGVGDSYTCIGDNQFETEPGVRQDQLIAVVRSFDREGREISVDQAGYKLYCVLWHHIRPVRKIWIRLKLYLRRFLSARKDV